MLDQAILDEVIDFNKLITTAKQHCDEYCIPYSVYIWRKKRGYAGKDLFKTPVALVHYMGESCTLKMISERTGIPYDVIRCRYDHGARGAKVIADYKPSTDDGIRERMKAQCRAHLRALIREHRNRAIEILKGASNDVEEPFDHAAAMLNAQRFVEAARDNLARSTGYTWDHAA